MIDVGAETWSKLDVKTKEAVLPIALLSSLTYSLCGYFLICFGFVLSARKGENEGQSGRNTISVRVGNPTLCLL